jgi:hypothetical protein
MHIQPGLQSGHSNRIFFDSLSDIETYRLSDLRMKNASRRTRVDHCFKPHRRWRMPFWIGDANVEKRAPVRFSANWIILAGKNHLNRQRGPLGRCLHHDRIGNSGGIAFLHHLLISRRRRYDRSFTFVKRNPGVQRSRPQSLASRGFFSHCASPGRPICTIRDKQHSVNGPAVPTPIHQHHGP